MRKIIISLFLVFGVLFGRDELLLDSANAYKIVMGANSKIAGDFASRSHAVVIFPTFIKAGFFLGGSGGKGVMLERGAEGYILHGVKIGGANLGFQIGYENSYLVIYVLNQSIVNDIKDAKFTVGANASVSMIDKGVNARSASDFSFNGDLKAFSNNSGFFVGANIDGAVMATYDAKFNLNSYGYKELIKAVNMGVNETHVHDNSNLNQDTLDNSQIVHDNSNLNENNEQNGEWVNPADTGVAEITGETK